MTATGLSALKVASMLTATGSSALMVASVVVGSDGDSTIKFDGCRRDWRRYLMVRMAFSPVLPSCWWLLITRDFFMEKFRPHLLLT